MEENAVLENTKTNVNDDNEHFICHQCHRSFKTHRGLTQHPRACKTVLHILRNDEQQVQRNDDAVSSQVKTHVMGNVIKVNKEKNVESFYWNAIKGSEITRTINDIYNKIVYWRKNLFMLPNGSSEKNYVFFPDKVYEISFIIFRASRQKISTFGTFAIWLFLPLSRICSLIHLSRIVVIEILSFFSSKTDFRFEFLVKTYVYAGNFNLIQ